ncbi:MAG: heme exporter protein CcmB [Ignavibacteriota bacterium]|nr:heme exporter protein CcmB [Ignavibacteriota bacterium]
MELLKHSYSVFKKDIKSEIKNRYVINSLLMFVVITISIIRFSLGDEKAEDTILSGLFWIVIFFTAISGLSRVFIKEEETGTSLALKLSAGATEVFLGKLFFNFVLTFSLNMVIFFLFSIITGIRINNFFAFALTVILGNFGIVSASTIIAAIIAKANSKGTLYPVLAFPVLLPLLITMIDATKLASEGVPTVELMGNFQILVSYTVVITVVSLFLFRFIWED